MSAEADISFRPLAAADLDMVAGWLAEPHVRQWWGDPETELAGMRDMIEGRDPTRPYLVVVDGDPIGFVQSWRIEDARDAHSTEEHPWLLEIPDGAAGMDILIGAPERISKGLGSATVAAFAAKLAAEGHSPIVIDPDAGNRRAVRAYEKAGFRAFAGFEGVTDGVLLMRYDPDPGHRLSRTKQYGSDRVA